MSVRGEYAPAQRLIVHAHTTYVEQPMADRHDGLASAVYACVEFDPVTGRGVYELVRVDECLPPTAPQERALLFTDQQRLPMMDQHGFSVRLEAAQRQKEWLEWDAQQGIRIGSGS